MASANELQNGGKIITALSLTAGDAVLFEVASNFLAMQRVGAGRLAASKSIWETVDGSLEWGGEKLKCWKLKFEIGRGKVEIGKAEN
jgi:hypothetical protein